MKKHNPWIAFVLVPGLMLAVLLTIGAVYAETHPAPAGPGDIALEFISYLGGKNEGVAVQATMLTLASSAPSPSLTSLTLSIRRALGTKFCLVQGISPISRSPVTTPT